MLPCLEVDRSTAPAGPDRSPSKIHRKRYRLSTRPTHPSTPHHDMLIVGAGPCGIAVAIAAKEAGLDYQILDRGSITSSLTRYPYYMTFFSTAERLEIGGVPFTIPDPKPTRREALAYYRGVVRRHGIQVRQQEDVTKIEGSLGHFHIHTRRGSRAGTTSARTVVLATGGFGEPNYLGVPGEELGKVLHYYLEPFPFYDQNVLVVGGANSAVESALEMHRNGARVQMVHFNDVFDSGVKPWVLPDMLNRIQSNEVPMHWRSRVREITETSVTILDEETGRATELANDWVVAMTGWRPDRGLMTELGVDIDEETGVPSHDHATMETNVPGVYIAGVIAAGNNANKIFIENGRHHGALVAKAVAGR